MDSTEVRSPNWFIDQLTSARVYEDAQIRPYLDEFRESHPKGSARDLAQYLTSVGIITEYQGQQTLLGEISKLVLGSYLLAMPVGTGSLGTVYQALGRRDRKRYAVKVLPLRSVWNTHQAKKQVSTFSALPPHPAILPLVDIDTAGGSHYLVWKYAEGTTLLDRLKSGPIPISEVIRIMTQVVDGLAVCHANGIAHGLLKPSNIILGPDGQSRILDLGMGAILSENIADDESMFDTISTANAAMGMMDCCAPETLTDPKLRSTSGDLYSLGCIFYVALTGSLPFPEGNIVDKVIAHQTQPPRNPKSIQSQIPDWLARLTMSLLGKTPADRPASIRDVQATIKAGAATKIVAKSGPATPDPDRPNPEQSRLSTPSLMGMTDSQPLSQLLPPTQSQPISQLLPPTQSQPISQLKSQSLSQALSGSQAIKHTPILSAPQSRLKPGIIKPTSTRKPDAEEVSFDAPAEGTDPVISLPHAKGDLSNDGFNAGPAKTDPLLDLALAPVQPSSNRMSNSGTSIKAVPSHIGPKEIEGLIEQSRLRTPSKTPLPGPKKKGHSTSAPLPNPIDFNVTTPTKHVVTEPPLPDYARSWWYYFKQLLGFQGDSDLVQVSVYGQLDVSPGDTIPLQVYVHTPDTADSVRTLSRAFHSTDELIATGYVQRPVSLSDNLGLHLAVVNAGVARSLVIVGWRGQPQPRMFEVHVPWESPAGRTRAVLSLAINGTLAGTIEFPLDIQPRRG